MQIPQGLELYVKTSGNKYVVFNFGKALTAALEKDPPQTLRETAAIIKDVSGLERSLLQVMKFLKKRV